MALLCYRICIEIVNVVWTNKSGKAEATSCVSEWTLSRFVCTQRKARATPLRQHTVDQSLRQPCALLCFNHFTSCYATMPLHINHCFWCNGSFHALYDQQFLPIQKYFKIVDRIVKSMITYVRQYGN